MPWKALQLIMIAQTAETVCYKLYDLYLLREVQDRYTILLQFIIELQFVFKVRLFVGFVLSCLSLDSLFTQFVVFTSVFVHYRGSVGQFLLCQRSRDTWYTWKEIMICSAVANQRWGVNTLDPAPTLSFCLMALVNSINTETMINWGNWLIVPVVSSIGNNMGNEQ